MVIKLSYGSGLGEGLSSAGGSIGEALKKASARRLKQKQGTALESALQQAMVDPETGQQRQLGLPEIMQFINKASSAGVAPEMLKPYTDI